VTLGHPRQATLVLRQRILAPLRGSAINETTAELVGAQRHIIKRPRLTRLLDETTARIILLVAPAGYGKTTLAREWCESRWGPTVWYRAGASAADVAALAADISRVVETVVPGAGEALRDYLRGQDGREPNVATLAQLLGSGLICWPQHAILVLDDYHQLIESRASDDFMGLIAQHAPIRLLLCGRSRPVWALARQLIYGQIFELDRAELAMTKAEVDEILPVPLSQEAFRLRQVAGGWPAVIGLAAHSSVARLPPSTLSHTLHSFFAQELFDRCAPRLQSALIRLAMLPAITDPLAAIAIGQEARATMAEAALAGFLTIHDGQDYELHPLLREFLRKKAPLLAEEDRQFVIDGTLKALIATHRWDDAFTVIVDCDVPHALPTLVEAALDHLLCVGRVATIRSWIEQARVEGLTDPLIDLAEGELAVRAGDLAHARFYGCRAASNATEEKGNRFRSLKLLGLVAQLSDDYETAISYYRSSEELAQTQAEVREALWGQFAAANHSESDDAIAIFSKLKALADEEPDDYLRLASGQFRLICLNHTSLETMSEELGIQYPLVSLATNPHIVSSFLILYAQCLMLSGHYSKALRIGIEATETAARFGLVFAVPYAQTVQAFAMSGLKRFNEADSVIRKLIDHASDNGDSLTLANARVARARLLLAQGAYADASEETDPRLLRASTPGMRGESLAVHALALACLGDLSGAELMLREARKYSRAVETETPALATEAVISLQAAINDDSAARFLQHVNVTRHVDAFVAAYRAYPDLLSTYAALKPFRSLVEETLARGDDREFAQGVAAWRESRAVEDPPLSRRELDVLALVAIGLGNAAIAQKLYISEATVKVHMRHIFEKLGVSSRTQAALHPVARRAHYATSEISSQTPPDARSL
jgi:LuxR family transcriptional regulator, maltose regulon positive regulatory protein